MTLGARTMDGRYGAEPVIVTAEQTRTAMSAYGAEALGVVLVLLL